MPLPPVCRSRRSATGRSRRSRPEPRRLEMQTEGCRHPDDPFEPFARPIGRPREPRISHGVGIPGKSGVDQDAGIRMAAVLLLAHHQLAVPRRRPPVNAPQRVAWAVFTGGQVVVVAGHPALHEVRIAFAVGQVRPTLGERRPRAPRSDVRACRSRVWRSRSRTGLRARRRTDRPRRSRGGVGADRRSRRRGFGGGVRSGAVRGCRPSHTRAARRPRRVRCSGTPRGCGCAPSPASTPPTDTTAGENSRVTSNLGRRSRT